MGPFVLDVLYGVLFVISIFISITGLMVFRYRRGQGPLILAISGLPGALSSALFILESSNALEISLFFPLASLASFIVLILAAIVMWRGGE